MKLNELIKERLQLKGKSADECIKILDAKQDELNELMEQIQSVRKEYINIILDSYKRETEEKYSDLNPNTKNSISVTFPYDGKEIFVETNIDGKGAFCQVSFVDGGDIENCPKIKSLKEDKILDKKSNYNIWTYYERNGEGLKSAYEKFEEVVKELRKRLEL